MGQPGRTPYKRHQFFQVFGRRSQDSGAHGGAIARRKYPAPSGTHAHQQAQTGAQGGPTDASGQPQHPAAQTPNEFAFKNLGFTSTAGQRFHHQGSMFGVVRHHAPPKKEAVTVWLAHQPHPSLRRESFIGQGPERRPPHPRSTPLPKHPVYSYPGSSVVYNPFPSNARGCRFISLYSRYLLQVLPSAPYHCGQCAPIQITSPVPTG